MKVKSYIGGHPVRIFADCIFDESIRKYRGGHQIAEIPYGGKMLSAHIEYIDCEDIDIDGKKITIKKPHVISVDEPPTDEHNNYIIVSALYVSACKLLGYPTDKMLTVGIPVVDNCGNVIGTIGLNKN